MVALTEISETSEVLMMWFEKKKNKKKKEKESSWLFYITSLNLQFSFILLVNLGKYSMLMNPEFVEIGCIPQYKEWIDEMKAVQCILLNDYAFILWKSGIGIWAYLFKRRASSEVVLKMEVICEILSLKEPKNKITQNK